MNVASLELCRTLHELSGWRGTEFGWFDVDGDTHWALTHDVGAADVTPAYDLGYLLRKLPARHFNICKVVDSPEYLCYVYKNGAIQQELGADTPEDAAAKLALELFKQGVLTK